MRITKRYFIIPTALLGSFLLLLVLAAQYPMSTTFPIGGDAAFYVNRAQVLLRSLRDPSDLAPTLRSSWYPLSLLIFSTTAMLPLDWPARFTWSMAAAQVAVGIMLALLLRRLGGWSAAATVLVVWAITTTGINSHVEDGTLAHLISFIFLALFFERFTAGATWSALAALIATPLAHPITGLALLVGLTITAPALFSAWSTLSGRQKKQLLVICPASLLLLALILFAGKPILSNSQNISGVANNPFINTLVSRFAPVVALAPFGLLLLLKSRQPAPIKYLLASMFSLSALMAGNDLLGIAVWTDRLSPLFIFMSALLAALALPTVIQSVFSTYLLRAAFFLLLVVYFSLSAWFDNQHVFRFYEDPSNYARLHPAELSALYWIRDHLPPNSFIVTSDANRHTEWLPALTPLQWLPVSASDDSITNPTSDNLDSLTYHKLKYLAFFTLREKIRGRVLDAPHDFPLVFSNQAVSIYNIPSQIYGP